MIQPAHHEESNGSTLSSESEGEGEGEGNAVLEDLIEECTNRIQAGESIDPAELAVRHPEHAERLGRLLPSLRMMAEAGRSVAEPLPAVQPATVPIAACPSGPFELGDFRVLRIVGRGGMGVVYEALQLSLNRRVALKVLPFAAALDPHQLRRFQIEAQAAAQLHHTSIVPVFCVGCEHGVHFYAMQFIEGRTVAALIEERRTAVRASAGPTRTHTRPAIDREYVRSVARLGIQAAEALDHAHRQGIIHRDVKPANLLVDVRGNLWITDFGLARFVNEAGLTITGDLIGTLRYMSPEQALAKRLVLDHRADIYSLGATLYELLSLRPAVNGRDRQEMLRRIAQEEPVPLRRIDPAIPRDVETIVLKAIATDPDERYATAGELAEDLRRFLEFRSVQARRPSLWTRTSKCVQRHRSLIAVMLILLIVSGLSAAIIGTLIGKHQRLETAVRSLDRSARRVRYARNIHEASLLVRQNRLAMAVDRLARQLPSPGETDDRDFAWHYLWRLCHVRPRTLRKHRGNVYHVAFSPDGRTLASCGEDGTVRLCDPEAGAIRMVLAGHGDEVNWAAFSPDGRRLATTGDDRTVKIWDVPTGALEATLSGHDQEVVAALFTLDGSRVVSCGRKGRIVEWALGKPEPVRSSLVSNGDLQSMAIAPDGSTLAIAGDQVVIWDLSGWRELRRLPPRGGMVLGVAFSHDGSSLAGCGGVVQIWRTSDWQPAAPFVGNTDRDDSVAFAPDDRRLLSGGRDGTIRLWDVESGRTTGTFRKAPERIWSVAMSPDGRTLAAGAEDGRIDLWETDSAQDRETFRAPVDGSILATARLGESLVFLATPEAHSFRLSTLDLARGRFRPGQEHRMSRPILGGTVSPSGRRIAIVEQTAGLTVWERTGEADRDGFAPVWGPIRVAGAEMRFSSDEHLLAISLAGQQISLFDVVHGRPISPPGPVGLRLLSFSPRGESVACAAGDDRLAIWDIGSRTLRESPEPAGGWIGGMDFSPDGQRMATGDSYRPSIRIWSRSSLKGEAILRGPSAGNASLAFSPDGRVLASGGADGSITLWDPATHVELLNLEGHTRAVIHLSFSGDGSTLVSCASGPSRPGVEICRWPAGAGSEAVERGRSGGDDSP